MLHRRVDLVDGSVKSVHIQNLNANLCRDIVGALNVDLPVRQMLHFDALSLCGACKMLHRRVDLVDGFVKSAHIQNLNAKLCRDIVCALNVDLMVRQMLHFDAPSPCGSRRWFRQICAHSKSQCQAS